VVALGYFADNFIKIHSTVRVTLRWPPVDGSVMGTEGSTGALGCRIEIT